MSKRRKASVGERITADIRVADPTTLGIAARRIDAAIKRAVKEAFAQGACHDSRARKGQKWHSNHHKELMENKYGVKL